MYSIDKKTTSLYEINKSKFYGFLIPINSIEEVDIILLALLIIANINAPYILAFIMSIGYQGTYTLHIIFLWLLLGLSCLIIIVLEIRLVTNSYLCDKFGHRVSKMLYMLFLCILIREILM